MTFALALKMLTHLAEWWLNWKFTNVSAEALSMNVMRRVATLKRLLKHSAVQKQ